MHCLLVITVLMHVCKLEPDAHVFNAFGFAFKSGCDSCGYSWWRSSSRGGGVLVVLVAAASRWGPRCLSASIP
jgi:hypothetical protein